MLEHLGEAAAAAAVHAAVESTLALPVNHTRDLGGRATTETVVTALEGELGDSQ